ncbi:Fucose 4-O-acetylase [Roseateles sp. YR242]|uniref:acyltransferase family protein n=1 Tax=Roseateles sp. YR242 TaxID=1855305 RepID=UPI0008B8370B|nr:acyltransferase [Roseateles sp. YR242]SEL11490.1 Fucose 4-O-acetylase [Roseateles sp. YR242]
MSSGLSINTLRGLACLLLVAYHVIGDSSAAGLRLPAEHPASQLNNWLALIRMPLFSFLSGMVYARRPLKGDIAPFAKGKMRRLLLPMLIVGTGFALLQNFVDGTNKEGDYNWWLLHTVPVAHYWFLEALFLIFLVTALMERLEWLSTPKRFAAVWLVAAVVVHCWVPLPVYFGLNGAAYLFPFFLLGVAAHRFQLDRFAPWVMPGLLAGMVALLVLLWAMTTPPVANHPGLQRLLVSVCACLLLLRLKPEVRWLAWLGAWSFGIYLFHPVFAAGARMALRSLNIHDVPTLFAAGMVAGLAGSIALTATLRRVPFGHWALGERPARPEPSAVSQAAGTTHSSNA